MSHAILLLLQMEHWVKVNKAQAYSHNCKNMRCKNLLTNNVLKTSEDIQENTATFNFNTLSYRQGKTKISRKQIKRIAFILATDLKNFAESNGNFSLLTANEVYSHLQNNQ